MYHRFPQTSPRTIASWMDKLVHSDHMLVHAVLPELDVLLLNGSAETGNTDPAMRVDCLRALVGAVWLDMGVAAALRFMQRHIVAPLAPRVEAAVRR